jgi:acid phosphatase
MMTNKAAALFALALTSASCTQRPAAVAPSATSAPATAAPAAPGTAAPASQHRRIAVVVMENKAYGKIVGNPSAPYLNELARASALATSFYAVAHPSLPNYLALLGGDTFGISSDCTSCHVGAHNLVDQLERAQVSWTAYMDAMPNACFKGSWNGRYAKKHDPFMYFDDVVSDASRCAQVVPITHLVGDEQRGLADFVWITPDMCHDMHDCSVETGDAFLRTLLPPLIAALGPHGVVFVTFDEGSGGAHGGGHVVTIVAGGGARPGRYDGVFTHYSLLRTIDDQFGLQPLRRASGAASMSALLR